MLIVRALLVCGLLFLGQICFAQSADPMETLRVDSNLVDLKVNVVNRGPGVPPSSLQQKDFLVLEDGVPQEISFFAAADAPFDLVLLLDLSGSTATKLKLVRKSAERFVEATRPTDRIAVVTFTAIPRLLSPLTYDRGALRNAIQEIEEPMGGTNFWDSLKYVLERVLNSKQVSRRSAVVVMTDGVDNALPDVFGEGSHTTFREVMGTVETSDALVFPIYLDTEKEGIKRHLTPRSAYAIARSQLAQLAETCGATMYRAEKLKDLESVYEQIVRDLHTVYSIGYRPKNTRRDGTWRVINVRLLEHPDLTSRAKPGYFGKSPTQN